MKQHSILLTCPKGFTLVEVMVAMVIGMIGIIIMMQVFATTEGQKRSTTGTGDAQSSGAMALYELQRDIRQSGYGINSTSLLSCRLALPTAPLVPVPLGPAIINPQKVDNKPLLPGDPNTDTLLVTFGNSGVSPEGDAIKGGSTDQPQVGTPKNFSKDDWVIGTPAADGNAACAPPLTLARVGKVEGSVVPVNPESVAGATLLFNLGATPKIRAYAIRSGNLTVCDYTVNDCSKDTESFWLPIASNIVSLRAEYGHDNDIAIGVDTWDQTTPTTACGWVRASALRLAVVARNSQFEKLDEKTGQPVTPVAPTWEGSVFDAQKNPVPAPFDLTKTRDGDGWKQYRYKVFETVVPIRNLTWMARCS